MQKKIKSERFIWIDIMLTLLAIEVMQYFYYGIRAVALGGVCAVVSFVAEIVSLNIMKRDFTADDLTCISDALIISLMLPAVMDFKIAGIACVFAVIVAKNIFGGRVNMIFSPSAVAYIFMLVSWKNKVLMFTEPHVHTGISEKAENLVSSASHVFNTSGRMSYSDFEILMGNVRGAGGAVSILLLMVSAVILILRRDISVGAFLGTISGTVLMAYCIPVCRNNIDSVKYTLVSNMILFTAIYIISDKRTAPRKNYYAFFYGFFIAVISYILLLKTEKENIIIIVSVLFAPVSLAFRNLEKNIELLETEEVQELE